MISFIEETHTYLNSDGVIIPSVSALIRFAFPSQYADIPKTILQAKAKYGTKVHQTIEEYEGGTPYEEIAQRNIDPNILSSLEQYIRIKNDYKIDVVSMERIISYDERYAGTYDILTKDKILIDMKTTSQVHLDYLECQLGLYSLALGLDKDYAYCLWLPKGKYGGLIKVNIWKPERCIKLLEDYENAQINNVE